MKRLSRTLRTALARRGLFHLLALTGALLFALATSAVAQNYKY